MTTAHAKAMPVCVKDASAPGADQLAAIRAYTLRDFTPDELMVRTFVLAHNGIDRDNECFDEQLLADFARTMPGKGCYIEHPGWNNGGPAEGRVFGAQLQRMSFDAARQMLREPSLTFPPDRTEAVLLLTDTFFVRTQDNASLLAKMDAGIAGDISIGFSATGPVQLKDLDGRDLNAYRWQSPGEGAEQSLVWLGAQQGARAVKHAPRNPLETAMELTPEQIKALQTENATLKATQVDNAKAAVAFAALTKALGEGGEVLAAQPEVLAGLVADGRKFHATLVDQIVTVERHLKLCGDGPEDVKAARELYAQFPVAKLEKTLAALEARNDPRARIAGGDPNSTVPGANQKTGDGADKKSPLDNPLLAG